MPIDTVASHPAARSTPRGGVVRFAALTTAAVAGAAVLATVDPNEGGHYPTCPFLDVTGLYCPGCGTLRACHALIHLDPLTALERNPLFVVALPFILFCWAMWALRLAGRTAWSTTLLAPGWLWAMLWVLVGYWALRNVPGLTWLSPA